jgi:hypothetical protein
LWLRVEGGDTLVKIVVEDNGIGREAAQIIKAKNPTIQTAHGLQVTAERLAYFSQKYGIQTQVETADLFDAAGAPAGTRVTLTFQTNE